MCGRVVLDFEVSELLNYYGLQGYDFFESYHQREIFPTDQIPILFRENDITVMKKLKWGFITEFTKSPIINARGETLQTKPIFKNRYINNRCIIPVSGFFEWQKDGNKKVKHLIKTKDNKIFPLAGLYGNFKDKLGNDYTGFVIITTVANEIIRPIHERMPVILDKEGVDIWINSKEKNLFILDEYLKPYKNELMAIQKIQNIS